jgi:hypothetical protein
MGRDEGELVILPCCIPETYWNSSNPINKAETPNMMRFTLRAELRVSVIAAKEESLSENTDAVKPKMNVRIIREKEGEKYSLAQMHANKIWSEVCTAPC